MFVSTYNLETDEYDWDVIENHCLIGDCEHCEHNECDDEDEDLGLTFEFLED